MSMDTQSVIKIAQSHLRGLSGKTLDIIDVSKPVSIEAAINLTKIVSKLSPLVGNLIEFDVVEFLNKIPEFEGFGEWERQDPGFPDTIFRGVVDPTPGFEVKVWFPLATEITARFKDSQNHFSQDETYVAMLSWLPEFVIYGKPKILDIVIVSGASVAKARDDHYHNPPDYIILEPEDTASRTSNLQQTNTNGYKFQGTASQFLQAQQVVSDWGHGEKEYKSTPEYQMILRTLIERFPYRLDTNFAKMNRIRHAAISEFKTKVYATNYMGMTILAWNRLLSRGGEKAVAAALAEYLDFS